MLIRFIASNFLSFNEEVEFNMLSGSYRTHKHHVYSTGKLKVLKGAAIYGANGAGKSNLVKAISFLQSLVKHGKLEKSITPKKFKLNKENIDLATELEVEFSFKKKIYAYGISINGNTLEKEWLYLSGIDKEDKLIFEREKGKDGKQHIKLANKYLKTQKDRLLIELMEENLLKENELLLGKTDNLKIAEIDNAKKWLTEYLFFMYPDDKSMKHMINLIESKDLYKLNPLLQAFDTGLKELYIEEMGMSDFFGKDNEEEVEKIEKKLETEEFYFSEEDNVMFERKENKILVKKLIGLHENLNNEDVIFEIEEESDGTQRLLDMIPILQIILNLDVTFIIDEIDESLHPSLLYTLVKKIMDEENTKGQLIFTTHEANLLDMNIFRQDEVWFVEKNKSGSTQLYALSDFKPRYDLDIRKGYLKGRFGAIPFVTDLKNLNWQRNDA